MGERTQSADGAARTTKWQVSVAPSRHVLRYGCWLQDEPRLPFRPRASLSLVAPSGINRPNSRRHQVGLKLTRSECGSEGRGLEPRRSPAILQIKRDGQHLDPQRRCAHDSGSSLGVATSLSVPSIYGFTYRLKQPLRVPACRTLVVRAGPRETVGMERPPS